MSWNDSTYAERRNVITSRECRNAKGFQLGAINKKNTRWNLLIVLSVTDPEIVHGLQTAFFLKFLSYTPQCQTRMSNTHRRRARNGCDGISVCPGGQETVNRLKAIGSGTWTTGQLASVCCFCSYCWHRACTGDEPAMVGAFRLFTKEKISFALRPDLFSPMLCYFFGNCFQT